MAKPRAIVLIGPTHPYTGGISQHTTRLALELEHAGHQPVVESWKAQYPKRLYPGTPTVPDGEPEIGIPHTVNTDLAWYSPISWWRVGRRHRGCRLVVNIPTAFHAIPYSIIAHAAGPSSEIWGIVHNVRPHDAGRLSQRLMSWLLRRLDRIVVHGDDARSLAVDMGVDDEAIAVLALPSPWPAANQDTGKKAHKGPLRLLFFGTIRPYKGLDVLLEAMSQTPGVTLTVAGEFWEQRDMYDQIISTRGLSDRVTIIPGYLPSSRFDEVFGEADVLVLPYRSGTGSIVREVGFRFGLPVIATTVGSIGDGIEHDQTGLLIDANSIEAVVDALKAAGSPGTLMRWRKGVTTRQSVATNQWAHYVDVVTGDFFSSPSLRR